MYFPSQWDLVGNRPETYPSTWSTVSGKPETYQSTWSLVEAKPLVFPSDWSLVANKPDFTSTVSDGVDASLLEAEFVLCEADVKIAVPVGSVIEYRGTEYIDDPTFIKTGQTVNRADYIELANALGIPKSQTTFTIPDQASLYWNNILEKPANFQADWSTTVINKPTLFSGDYNDLTNTPTTTTGIVGSYGLFAYFPDGFQAGVQSVDLSPGDTSAGSKLFYANTRANSSTVSGYGTVYEIGAISWSPSGTWRLMGAVGRTVSGNPSVINGNLGARLACISLWVRVS
jgi:hypothetical protein